MPEVEKDIFEKLQEDAVTGQSTLCTQAVSSLSSLPPSMVITVRLMLLMVVVLMLLSMPSLDIRFFGDMSVVSP